MAYQPVMIYDYDGEFVGYSIKNRDYPKLQTMNIWGADEGEALDEQVARLNNKVGILDHWPALEDPEVQALLKDPNWEPVQDVPTEFVDEENSILIWKRVPQPDLGFDGVLDEDASTIFYKTVMITPQVLVQARWKKAQELIARKRSGIEE